jgi:hypothetical protein
MVFKGFRQLSLCVFSSRHQHGGMPSIMFHGSHVIALVVAVVITFFICHNSIGSILLIIRRLLGSNTLWDRAVSKPADTLHQDEREWAFAHLKRPWDWNCPVHGWSREFGDSPL